MASKINVFYIALEFAPVQTTGAFRSIEFVRYLPEFGIKPYVVTVKPVDGMRIFSAVRNDALLSGLTSTVSIAHLTDAHPIDPSSESRLGRLARFYTNLDDTFYKRFRASLGQLLFNQSANKHFDAVIASAPPFGATRLGVQAADSLKCPLILDMRDSWVEFGYAPSTTVLHHYAKRRDEAATFRAARKVVTVTERLAHLFRASHPELPSNRFAVIPNGFSGVPFESQSITIADKGRFSIAYVGSFYFNPDRSPSFRYPHRYLQHRTKKEDWSYRGPQYFFAAWKELMQSAPEIAKRIRFHHIGTTPDFLMPMAHEYGLDLFCRNWGVVPKQKVGEILTGMDAMLATSMKREDGGDYCLASKTFDYILAKKPVLGFVCEGSQRDFLERAGIAVLCDPDDPLGSAEMLRRIVTEGVTLQLNADYVNQFQRREAARRMAEVIFEVTGCRRAGDEKGINADSALPYI